MSHHGLDKEAQDAMSAAMQQIFGEFPDGKLNANDEGALAVVIGHEKQSVVMRFPKPVAWIGFTPEQALEIAESLIQHARKAGGLLVPLVLRVGGDK